MTAPVHFTKLYGVIVEVILAISAIFWMRSTAPGWALWPFWL